MVKAMCLDSGDELRAAWRAIQEHGGLAKQARALELLGRMPDRPEPLTWRSAPRIMREHDRLDYLRDWTAFFRQSYREAREEAERLKGEEGRAKREEGSGERGAESAESGKREAESAESGERGAGSAETHQH